MDASELDYDLPEHLIAQAPPTARDGGRLLVLDRAEGSEPSVLHRRIRDLPTVIAPALFVVNDTRVLPARLFATKATGGRVELLLVERLEGPTLDGGVEREVWSALGRGTKSLRLRMRLDVEGAPLSATVRALREGGELEIELASEAPVRSAIHAAGKVPLTPYIRRDVAPDDRERYQTMFAAVEGSVAAPTAGLHFTPELLALLGRAGHQLAKLTLHVGPGTFAPLRTDDLDEHRMHGETLSIPDETVRAIAAARAERRPVVAVGTTVCRALESAAQDDGVRPGPGRTQLFIRPPYPFRVIDALLTNFHLPRSTLLALVMAFGGIRNVRAAYAAAVQNEYRFFSYGDAMLVRAPKDARV